MFEKKAKEEAKAEDADEGKIPRRRFSKTKTMGLPTKDSQNNGFSPKKKTIEIEEFPRSSSPDQWGKNKFERQKSNVKMSNIENLNKFVILQNIKRKYKESSLENNEESESFFIAADWEVVFIHCSITHFFPFWSKQLNKFYMAFSFSSKGSLKSIEEAQIMESECQVAVPSPEKEEDEYIPEEFTAIQRHFLMEKDHEIRMGRINKLRKDKSNLRISKSVPRLAEFNF